MIAVLADGGNFTPIGVISFLSAENSKIPSTHNENEGKSYNIIIMKEGYTAQVVITNNLGCQIIKLMCYCFLTNPEIYINYHEFSFKKMFS